MTGRVVGRIGVRCAAALVLAWVPSALPAQVPGTAPGQTQPTDRGTPQEPSVRRDPFGFDRPEPLQQGDPLDPVWSPMPRPTFEGFPVFPSRLSGYGNYPSQGLPTQGLPTQGLPTQGYPNPFGGVPLLPIAPPEDPGWPSWVRLQQRRPLPFARDLALLVQHADRVWWRQTEAAAFVPLFFHDKLRTLEPGAEVEVRQAGEFELLLHTSSRVVSIGPAQLRIAALDDANVELDVRSFTRLRISTREREHVVRLPDGSQLRLAGLPPAVAGPFGAAAGDGATSGDGASQGQVLLLLVRADEPSRYGGRATIFNAGARSVQWRHAFGEETIAPGQRVTMFLAPPAAAIGAPLAAEGGEAVVDDAGRAVALRGGDDTALSWCGARFRVPAGGTLRLEALQGAPFAPDGPAPKQDTP